MSVEGHLGLKGFTCTSRCLYIGSREGGSFQFVVLHGPICTGRWREIYCLVNLPIKEVVNFFRMFLGLTGLLGVSSGKQSSAKQIVKQFTCHLCFCLSEKYE